MYEPTVGVLRHMENSAPSLKILRTKFPTSALYNWGNKNWRQNPVWEFTKTIIPFTLVGYEVIITNLCYTLVGYFITSYPTRAHGIIVMYGGNMKGTPFLKKMLIAAQGIGPPWVQPPNSQVILPSPSLLPRIYVACRCLLQCYLYWRLNYISGEIIWLRPFYLQKSQKIRIDWLMLKIIVKVLQNII